MSRHIDRESRSLCVVAATVAVAILASCAVAEEPPALTEEQRQLNLDSFDYVWTTIRDKHYDPNLLGLDWDKIREELRPRVEKASSRSEARAVLDEMIQRLGQSHFNIIPERVYEDLGQGGGGDGVTGIDARVVKDEALVTSVAEDSPAAKAGVRPGWIISRIGDRPVKRIVELVSEEYEGKSWKAGVLSGAILGQLRGKVGEKVSVTFVDGSDKEREMEIDLVEERGRKARFGHLPPVRIWAESEMLEENIGVLSFNMWLDPAHVMPVINEAMGRFMESNGVIIDIRGNGGGLPEMGMGLAGWLVQEKKKHLGTMYVRDVELKFVVNPRPRTFDGPVVVLVDELSGSASEMFSGGMKDLGRAHIVGARTMGAALPSIVEMLPNGDGFQYAFANYVSAGGEVLEQVGVIPHREVLPTREQLLEGRDPAMEAAVAWILEQ